MAKNGRKLSKMTTTAKKDQKFEKRSNMTQLDKKRLK